MTYLLLPADEAILRANLTGELGLTPIAHSPQESPELPRQAAPEAGRWEFVYWVEAIGPRWRLGDSSRPPSPCGRVTDRINQDALGDAWTDAVDLARTPVIRFRRSSWHRSGHLCPGALQASAAPVAEEPSELLSLWRRVARSLEAECERLNPFEHCTDQPVPQPRALGPFWVWARPQALAWVDDGGRVWPWSA